MSTSQLTHLETALLLSLLVVVSSVLLITNTECSSTTVKIAEYILLSITAYVVARPIVQTVIGIPSTSSTTPLSSAVNVEQSTATSKRSSSFQLRIRPGRGRSQLDQLDE